LEEKLVTKEYKKESLKSKGFLAQVSIPDFPIRGQEVIQKGTQVEAILDKLNRMP